MSEIQQGIAPATTIPELVDAIRQDTAGIGACESTLRLLFAKEVLSIEEVTAWLNRLKSHAERIDTKLRLAADTAYAVREALDEVEYEIASSR